MVDVVEELKKQLKDLKEYIALATISAKNYQKTNIEMVKELTETENIPGVYVTLSKPFNTMEKTLKNAGVDTRMIIFIDAVTQTTGAALEKTDKCLFIGSPEKLSDISIAMDQAVRALPSQDKFVFFDSLNILLLYNEVDTVARFIHFLASKMRSWKVRGIIVSLRKKQDEDLIEQLTQFCDVTLDFD